jgi:NtrC-family two-component system sensor histidine kinase KinB
MRLKLVTKFVLLLLLLAVVPAALVGIRTISINRAGMQDAILELHSKTAAALADSVSVYLENLEKEIQFILRTLSAQMTWTDRQAVLQSLLDTNGDFVAVSIVDRKGQELLKAYNPALEKEPRLISRADDPTFTDLWSPRKSTSRSAVYFVEDEPRIDIVFPLGDTHCLFTTITLKDLWNKITQTRVASTGYAFLVDDRGRIIAHPDMTLAKKKFSAERHPIVRMVLQGASTGSREYADPRTNKQIVGAYAAVKGLRWGMIIQQDAREAFTSVYRMERQAALLILIALIAAALSALYIARSLSQPIMTLIAAAKRIAARDFSTRVTVSTKDELHDLAETFNHMTTELQRYDEMQVDKIVEEKTKTESIIYSIADGIVMTDKDGRLQLVNTQAKEILGLPADGWQDKPLGDLLKDDARRHAFEEVLKDRTAKQELDLSSNGRARYYLLSASEVVTPVKKEKIGLVTVLRNITLEKELDKMKEDFLHSITHDLRNPMTSIRGFLKFLLDGIAGPVNEQQKKMLETMDRASHRLMSLINDILDNAKLEAGHLKLALSEVDLRQLAQKNLDIAEGVALKKNITLKLDCPENLPKIVSDSDLMERVFSNLIGNALKFTPEQGSVTVSIADKDDRIEAAIIDTGEGIPPEYTERIFDKFQQVEGQKKGGTGLGLTICKHIVEAHLGKIWAESKPGEGARFIFSIPKDLTPDKLMSHPAGTNAANGPKNA